MIYAMVGAGGKTSYIKQKAKEYLSQGKRVFVCTSTHMYIEEDTVLSDDAQTIIQELETKHYCMAGIPSGKKISTLSKETYEKVCLYADVVLIEADGSKHLPLKYPDVYEPVIYENVDEIVIVCGLHALGKKVKDVIHRFPLAMQYLGMLEDEIITKEHIQTLVKKGYVEMLEKKYPDKKMSIYANHDQSLYQRCMAKLIEANMDVSILKEEWFQSQPTLIVCGGGHVAYEIVKMASYLDFYIKVMDDREEFANKERFKDADEVIFDSFENVGNYVEDNAYYVVVTRGHKDDHICVKEILQHSFAYLGMIGSKLKVQKTFENLKKEGIPQEKMDRIFAPIGLDIKAITPAEIAISILAEIILEKNKIQTSSVSRELLHTKEKGTLCIITKKKGSSPRGEGSMMFVHENGTIDSVGGGAVEVEAIKEALHCDKVQIKQYDLNNEKSVNLGMICGGSNEVLFIPLEEVSNT